MFQIIFLLLKAFGFLDKIPAGIPMILNLLPGKVTLRNWDMVMSNIYGVNFLICLVIFIAVTIYYAKSFKISGPGSVHSMWWSGLALVFSSVYIVSSLLTVGDLSTVDGLPVAIGEIIFPIGLFMAIDAVVLYVVFSILYGWWPAVVRGALPPVCWFKR